MIYPVESMSEARELVGAREAVYLGAVSKEAAQEILERGEDLVFEGRPAPEDQVWVRNSTPRGTVHYARYLVVVQ